MLLMWRKCAERVGEQSLRAKCQNVQMHLHPLVSSGWNASFHQPAALWRLMSELFSLDCFIRKETTKNNWTHRSDVSANTICGLVIFVLIYWEVRAQFISTQIWRLFDSVLKPLHSCFDKCSPQMINSKEIYFFSKEAVQLFGLLCPYFPVLTP